MNVEEIKHVLTSPGGLYNAPLLDHFKSFYFGRNDKNLAEIMPGITSRLGVKHQLDVFFCYFDVIPYIDSKIQGKYLKVLNKYRQMKTLVISEDEIDDFIINFVIPFVETAPNVPKTVQSGFSITS